MSHPKDEEKRYYEYNWIDGAESLEKYRPGGYHPIMIADMLHGRYQVVDKLGFGGYSTVWLARDTRLHCYVAVKVGIGGSTLPETTILRALATPLPSSSPADSGPSSIPVPLDEFELNGPNGTHRCYTMTPARCDLKEVSYSRLFPLDVARVLAGGLTRAIAYLHSQAIAHGDIHLRNVLAKLPSSLDHLSVEQFYEKYGKPETVPVTQRDGESLPPNVPAKAVIPLYLGKDANKFSLTDAHIILSDFGEAFAPDSDVRLGKDCHTPLAMRAPEARFQPDAPLLYSADIWSLGVTIWEILGMKVIFSSEFATEDEIISQQIDVLGPMPPEWWGAWEERSQFFDDDGRPKEGHCVWSAIDRAFEEDVQVYRRKFKIGEFGAEETVAILDLMRKMLAFRPEERPTVQEVLRSEWMVKWVLPDLDRSSQIQ
ncbi:kinase-like domain-containing protein [Aspergillus coremiiformis]|uniref:non-specific serine/threonine protein kinase n=1 Tax=Aspergillus coremiiformis TaxID=138285 RepID=A0A5N6ZJ01_9EURO|nr:kinase-like domain-containing protein [Aspergillus coremiiformis]